MQGREPQASERSRRALAAGAACGGRGGARGRRAAVAWALEGTAGSGGCSMAALHNSASLPKNFAPYKATYKAMSPAKVSACLISSPCCSLTLLLML